MAQLEQLKKIGEYLYREREERAIPLEEVAVKTYIPLRLLQALEQGQVERLPEPVFVQGFIRRYADTLGLDGLALSKTFVLEPSPTNPKPYESESTAHAPVLAPVQESPRRSNTSTTAPSYLPMALLGGLAIVLLGVGAMSVLNKPRQTTTSSTARTAAIATNQPIAASPAPEPPQPSVQPSPVVQTPASPKPKASAPIAPLAGEAPIQAAVELTGESWMQVIVDGKAEYEGIQQKGFKRTWTARKSLTVATGNAGAVLVSYNQSEAKPVGAPGEVKDVTFTARPVSQVPTAESSLQAN